MGAESARVDGVEVALQRLLTVTGASFEQRAHLERALDSRIEIEQAKGILAERLRLSLDEAFELLRGAARSNRTGIHELARAVIAEPHTPAQIVGALQRTLATRAGGKPR